MHFSFAIITKIYEKLKNANIISLSTCTKNTTELARLLVDFHKTNLLIEETRLVKKSRLKPGKEPHAAREPRVGHPCAMQSKAGDMCIDKTWQENEGKVDSKTVNTERNIF